MSGLSLPEELQSYVGSCGEAEAFCTYASQVAGASVVHVAVAQPPAAADRYNSTINKTVAAAVHITETDPEQTGCQTAASPAAYRCNNSSANEARLRCNEASLKQPTKLQQLGNRTKRAGAQLAAICRILTCTTSPAAVADTTAATLAEITVSPSDEAEDVPGRGCNLAADAIAKSAAVSSNCVEPSVVTGTYSSTTAYQEVCRNALRSTGSKFSAGRTTAAAAVNSSSIAGNTIDSHTEPDNTAGCLQAERKETCETAAATAAAAAAAFASTSSRELTKNSAAHDAECHSSNSTSRSTGDARKKQQTPVVSKTASAAKITKARKPQTGRCSNTSSSSTSKALITVDVTALPVAAAAAGAQNQAGVDAHKASCKAAQTGVAAASKAAATKQRASSSSKSSSAKGTAKATTGKQVTCSRTGNARQRSSNAMTVPAVAEAAEKTAAAAAEAAEAPATGADHSQEPSAALIQQAVGSSDAPRAACDALIPCGSGSVQEAAAAAAAAAAAGSSKRHTTKQSAKQQCVDSKRPAWDSRLLNTSGKSECAWQMIEKGRDANELKSPKAAAAAAAADGSSRPASRSSSRVASSRPPSRGSSVSSRPASRQAATKLFGTVSDVQHDARVRKATVQQQQQQRDKQGQGQHMQRQHQGSKRHVSQKQPQEQQQQQLRALHGSSLVPDARLQQLLEWQQQQQQLVAAASHDSSAAAAAAGGGGVGEYLSGLHDVMSGHLLQRDRWHLVRVHQAVCCAAANGTVRMQTVDGGLELFQCNTILHPGALAAACIAPDSSSSSSSRGSSSADTGSSSSRVWLFCPDPLCLLSKPHGPELLPEWSWSIAAAPGLHLTKEEVAELHSMCIQVTADNHDDCELN